MMLKLFALAVVLSATEPSSSDDVAKAAKAYRQAQQAELGEEYALASDLYELADQLAPTPEALRGVVRMALAAERWDVAADNALELQRRYPDDDKSSKLAVQTLERTRPLLDELSVDCGGVDCTVLVDGKTARLEPAPRHILFVGAVSHRVAGGYPAGASEEVEISATAGGRSKVVLVPPVAKKQEPPPPTTNTANVADAPPPEAKPEKQRRKISPWYFGVGAVATVGLAAGTAVSGVQAQNAGEDFDAGGRTRELYDRANALEIQTNALLGVTVAVGVTTIVLAAVTDWRRGRSGGDRRRARITPNLGGVVLEF
jgi:hypothetical protein